MTPDPKAIVLPVIEDTHGGGARFKAVTVPIDTYAYTAPVTVPTWREHRHRAEQHTLADAAESARRLGVTMTRVPWLAHVRALVASDDPDGKPYWMDERAAPPGRVIRYELTVHTRGYITPEGARP